MIPITSSNDHWVKLIPRHSIPIGNIPIEIWVANDDALRVYDAIPVISSGCLSLDVALGVGGHPAR